MKNVEIVLVMFAAIGCVAASDGTPQKEVAIAAENAVIVSPSAATRTTAKELQLNLKEVCGQEIPIAETCPPGRFAFIIDAKPVSAEAWSWQVSPSNVIFSGTAKWAVYDFLERALGVRWPVGDMIVTSQQNPIRVELSRREGRMDVNIREIRAAMTAKNDAQTEQTKRRNLAFRRRMRDGKHDAPTYGHAFTQYWKKYGKDHRDYFGMRKDGLRGPKSATVEELTGNIAVDLANKKAVHVAMCCTSTGLVAQIVSNWIAAGKTAYINLCENDVPGQDSCQCPACKALDVVPEQVDPKWVTHYADRYVYFANRVLAAARAYRADVKVCYYAYNATQDAPKIQRPAAGTVIGVVPTFFTHKYIAEYLGSWSKVGANCYFYRPNRHHYFAVPYLPVGSERHFFDLLKYIRKSGSIGFDYDSPAKIGFFQWMPDYVLYRAMAYEDETFEEIESHWFDAFGPAKRDAMAYWKYWREQVWDARVEPNLDEIVSKGKWFNFGRGLQKNLKDYYKLSDFETVEPFLAAAERRDLSESQRRLVAEWRRAHDHAKIYFETLVHKTKENTERLIAFRKANGFPLYSWQEQYFGDLTGIKSLLGPEKKDEK